MKLSSDKISAFDFGNALIADRLFCNLSPKTRQSLKKIKHLTEFQENQVMVNFGEIPCCIYILLKGQAKFFTNTKLKPHSFARKLRRNEIFGIAEMLSNFPSSIRIEAISRCSCVRIGNYDFLELLRSDSEVSFRLLNFFGDNLQQSYKIFTHSPS